MKIGKIITATIAVSMYTSIAIGSEVFPIPQTVSMPTYIVEGKAIDILGLYPGMKSSDALEFLNDYKKNEEVRYVQRYMGTRDVRSESYPVLYYSWQRDREELNIFLTSPSAGSEVYAVSRSLNFRTGEQPTSADLLTSLVAKYGEPSGFYEPRTSTRTVAWYVGGKQICDLKHLDVGMARISSLCVEPMHATGPSVNNLTYNPSNAKHYMETAEAGSKIIVVASIVSYREDGRVSRLTVSFLDLQRRAASARADLELIEAEQAKFEQIKVEVPKL